MILKADEVPVTTEEGLGVCHVAISPAHRDIALCGVTIPDEPWCCGQNPSCGRPRCDSCQQVMCSDP